MGIKLGDNINITAGLPNDCRYQNAAVGPYTSVAQANSIVTSDIRYTGLTVNILGTEYWYKEGIGDGDLVEKTTGGGGGSGLLNWTGSTANAIGTYMSVSGICAQPNLTFNGTVLCNLGTDYVVGTAPSYCGRYTVADEGGGYTGIELHGNEDNECIIFRAQDNNISTMTWNGGFCYGADYSSVSATNPRWIPDAGWVTGQTSGGDVSKVGTPAICQVAVWTGDGTICGGSTLTMSVNTLCLNNAGIRSTGSIFTTGNGIIGVNAGTGCISLDSDEDGFSHITADATGSYCGWGACTFILATAGNNFVFVNGEENTLRNICANNITGNTFYGNGAGLTGTASSLTVGTATNANCLGGQVPGYYARCTVANVFTANQTAPIICATTCFAGSGAGLTGTASSLTVGTATNSTCLNGKLEAALSVCCAQNANAVDGLTSACFLRSSADDNLTSAIVVPTANRNEGIFGTYDSTKTQHIWSMGTGYRNAADGTDFGNLYGAAYKHTNNATGGAMASGHQMVWAQNGVGTAALGSNIWTSGVVIGTCFCGKAYDSDRLDNINSSSFLRSDAADIKTAGDLTFNDNISAKFGTGGDLSIFHNGSNAYISNATGGIYIRPTGTEVGVYVGANTCTQLYYNGSAKLKTISNGICVTTTGYATDWSASSDCRLKKCVTPITNALSIVTKLCGINYILCENNCEDIGLIAQDAGKVLPQIVTHSEPTEEQVKKYCLDDNDVLGIKYNKITALLIEAVKEQQETINNLENRLKTLENEKDI